MIDFRCGISSAILLTVFASTAARSQERVGGEFRVNQGEGSVFYPAVDAADEGGFVVVWYRVAPPGAQVLGQRYDASGNLLGDNFSISPLLSLARPVVDTAADGSFVVVWDQFSTGVPPDIWGRRFDASGAPSGSSFMVNSYTTGRQYLPDMASDADGGFVTVWFDPTRDGSLGGIFGRRFDAAGAPLGDDFQVNSYTTGYQRLPAVASDAAGNVVAVWQSDDQAGGNSAVFGQRYDASGSPLGGEFQVSDLTTHDQTEPDVASDPGGNFVVTWASPRPSAGNDVFARRFDASGGALGLEFRVNTYTTENQTASSVSTEADGDFVIVWESEGQDGSMAGVFGQQFAFDGTPVGEEFQANTYTSLRQHLPSVSADADGDFVVVWAKADFFANSFNVKAQRYAGPGLHLSVTGSCPGEATATIANAPPNTEVAVIAAANTNGFVKGGQLCPGTMFDIGEPFQLPPIFVIVDGEGRGATTLGLTANRCWVQALALADCMTSGVVLVPSLD